MWGKALITALRGGAMPTSTEGGRAMGKKKKDKKKGKKKKK